MLRALPVLIVLAGAGCTCKEDHRSKSGDQPPVVIVDPEELDRPRAVAEREPNDERSRAQDLPAERWIEGTLSTTGAGTGDADWYRVQVTDADQILRAASTGVPDLDLVLEAYSGEGQRLVRVNNSQQGGGEVLVNLSVTEGPYYLVVREVQGRSSAGRYRIGYTLKAREEGEELEPNWKADLATPLELDEEAIGYLGWHTDNDWYRVEIGAFPDGSRLRVELDGVDGVRAELAVRDAKEAPLQQRTGAPGQSIVLPNLMVPRSSGYLFIVVKCRHQSNVETRYSLRVMTTMQAGPTEEEPNDEPASATRLLPSISMAGLLADSRDVDLYRVASAQLAVYQVRVTPPMGLDVALAVLDREGKVVQEIDQGRAREPEILPAAWIQPPSGWIRLRAPRGSDVSPDASYIVRIEGVEGLDWEQEPNNSRQTATRWPRAQGAIRGHIHPGGDVDTFQITSGREQLDLVLATSPGDRLAVELQDEAGNTVELSTRTDAQGKTTLAAKTSTQSSYFLQIKGPSESFASTRGYRISRENP